MAEEWGRRRRWRSAQAISSGSTSAGSSGPPAGAGRAGQHLRVLFMFTTALEVRPAGGKFPEISSDPLAFDRATRQQPGKHRSLIPTSRRPLGPGRPLHHRASASVCQQPVADSRASAGATRGWAGRVRRAMPLRYVTLTLLDLAARSSICVERAAAARSRDAAGSGQFGFPQNRGTHDENTVTGMSGQKIRQAIEGGGTAGSRGLPGHRRS